MRKIGTVALAVVLAAGAMSLTACSEGPAEQAGEQMDGTTSGLKDKLTPDKEGEKAGKKIDRAVDDATK